MSEPTKGEIEIARQYARKILAAWDFWEEEAGREAQNHQLAEAGSCLLEGRLRVTIEDALVEYRKDVSTKLRSLLAVASDMNPKQIEMITRGIKT